mmetsp:Transcript_20599/g.34131  ORF Transcript_20599/g.34131 Transcript_20599/m.34131 type:complete len:321 (-) Transcript_20599:198-1160(-)|eukprot:CAMPEP_0119019132 /NCGR_PEP_ID=MMETSP1176-20130426/21031_1 /TAXON_ID=265551 /ORGANISM="Synedropsis recta cf, Strain CCMP1620" /LENGTH=320 /DNA_ID=CAMNT_0006973269 /DNA_START=109 /DNA_END=1071 /DNA_ORIENTATION=-
MANPAHALDVTPDTELQFTLSRNTDSTPRVTMTLHHPGNTDEYLAFKVKTTQPRRYLVRPNQGLVAPNSSESISILLVEKDKQVLLQSFDRLGQSALDHSKDKFLVQSCAATMDFAKKYSEEKNKAASQKGEVAAQTSKQLADALTSMWNTMTSGSTQPVYNKKLHVRHSVSDKAAPTSSSTPIKPHETSLAAMENMTPEQMFSEVSSLRRKYDELVSFSVNLTAERDILNNTLEQTKRDLNREIASRGSADKGLASASSGGSPQKSSLLMTILQMLVVAIAAFLAGVKFAVGGQADLLKEVPVVGESIFGGEEASMDEA